jgi:iron complex outermembrane receptor protein
MFDGCPFGIDFNLFGLERIGIMRKMSCVGAGLFLLLITSFTPAIADDPKPDRTDAGVFELGEVVVSAEGCASPGAVDRISENELRTFNLDKLSEALDLAPGVTVARTGARNERTVFVRGFDVKHVPLFMDGIPIYNMYDGYSDYSRFTTFDIAQITVSKSAASVLYGPNTMGGAINVITKRPDKPFETNAGIGVASGDTRTAYANMGTHQDKWYVQGGASYVDRDYFNLSDDFEPTATEDGGKRENSYLTDKKVSFKFGYLPIPGDEYTFSYSKQEAEKGNPVYTGDDPTFRIRYWQWPQWDKESYYFNSRTGIGADGYVKTRLYYDKYDNSLFSYDDATYTSQNRPSSFKSWYNDDTVGGSLEAGTVLGKRHDLKAALHYKRDQHKEHDNDEPKRTFRDEYGSIGLEDTIALANRWSMLAGASYDWQNALKAQEYDSTTRIISDVQTKDASAFNPQLGLFYDFSDNGSVYATIARKSRFPTMKDRYSYRMGSGLPNPDLDPEIATNYELGCKTHSGKIDFEGAAFFNNVEDYILLVTVPDPDDPTATVQQNQNVGRVYLYGAETQLTVRITDALAGGISYTYTQWDNRSGTEKIIDIPAHKIHAHVQYSPLKRLSLTADGTHYAGRYSSSNGVRETSSFTVVNFKAAITLLDGLKLETGINNAFDKNYAVEEGYPEEGVNFFANLTYRY